MQRYEATRERARVAKLATLDASTTALSRVLEGDRLSPRERRVTTWMVDDLYPRLVDRLARSDAVL